MEPPTSQTPRDSGCHRRVLQWEGPLVPPPTRESGPRDRSCPTSSQPPGKPAWRWLYQHGGWPPSHCCKSLGLGKYQGRAGCSLPLPGCGGLGLSAPSEIWERRPLCHCQEGVYFAPPANPGHRGDGFPHCSKSGPCSPHHACPSAPRMDSPLCPIAGGSLLGLGCPMVAAGSWGTGRTPPSLPWEPAVARGAATFNLCCQGPGDRFSLPRLPAPARSGLLRGTRRPRGPLQHHSCVGCSVPAAALSSRGVTSPPAGSRTSIGTPPSFWGERRW